MKTRFTTGQKVESRTDSQGLVKGFRYTVVKLRRHPTIVGDLVVYTLMDGAGVEHEVGNGHLLLTEVR